MSPVPAPDSPKRRRFSTEVKSTITSAITSEDRDERPQEAAQQVADQGHAGAARGRLSRRSSSAT